MLRTKNSNKISPNENSPSLSSQLTPFLLLLLFTVSKTWVGEVPGRADEPRMSCGWSRAVVAGRRRRAGSALGPDGACRKGDVKGGPDPKEDDADGGVNLAPKSTDPCF